jgi:hypothetical protein
MYVEKNNLQILCAGDPTTGIVYSLAHSDMFVHAWQAVGWSLQKTVT